MKILWTDFASGTLAEIYKYYKEVAGENVAQKIITDIFATTRQLGKHPYAGQLEETLKRLEEGHRYLVNGNYKIVYKVLNESILITDVFDTRQDPLKINDSKRKPSR
jgi:toxin ParE1/3/4